jgi:hypothetical protein
LESSRDCGNKPSGSIKCWETVATQLAASRVVLSSIDLVSWLVQVDARGSQKYLPYICLLNVAFEVVFLGCDKLLPTCIKQRLPQRSRIIVPSEDFSHGNKKNSGGTSPCNMADA